MKTIIKNGSAILKDRIIKNASVEITGSKISRVARSIKPRPGDIVINARGAYISPGFIDSHIHGMPSGIAANETKYGTTAFVVAVSCGRPIPDLSGYVNTLGARLEGPYINKKMAGAQSRRFILRPSVSNLAKLIKKGRGVIKMITIAPELKGGAALIKTCIGRNVMPSLGHSDASYLEAQRAFSSGIKHITHIFNAVSGPRHGSAGASTAALFDKGVTVEVIADLKHVKKDLLKLLFILKGKNKVILITDSVRAKSSGHAGGSKLTMIGAVKNVVTHCGVSLIDAVNMAALNPAALFGVAKRKGSLGAGKDADIIIFDKNFDVKMTMVRGRIVYSKRGFICAA